MGLSEGTPKRFLQSILISMLLSVFIISASFIGASIWFPPPNLPNNTGTPGDWTEYGESTQAAVAASILDLSTSLIFLLGGIIVFIPSIASYFVVKRKFSK